jgi:hypothetical protein
MDRLFAGPFLFGRANPAQNEALINRAPHDLDF